MHRDGHNAGCALSVQCIKNALPMTNCVKQYEACCTTLIYTDSNNSERYYQDKCFNAETFEAI